MEEKTYFTINNIGIVGVCNVSKETAEQDRDYNRALFPDEEWEMFEGEYPTEYPIEGEKSMERKFAVDVCNVPEQTDRFIIARYDSETRSLWYWGSWDNREVAEDIAKKIDGIVLEVVQ